jgi:hypothetical protein
MREMPEYNVRCYLQDLALESGYKKVTAGSPKEAAEKLCNCNIRGEIGKLGELCAEVRLYPAGPKILFYSDVDVS